MAKQAFVSTAVLDALRAAGIEPNNTRRVVIAFGVDQMVTAYVESYADEKVIDLVAVLLGESNIRIDPDEERDPRLARLRALCADRQAEAEGGGQTDVDAIWASEVLTILDGRDDARA